MFQKVLQKLCNTCAERDEDAEETCPPDTTSHYIEADNRCEDKITTGL